MTVSMEDLDALVAKAQQLKALLDEPEVLAFARTLARNSDPVLIIGTDRLVGTKEAAKMLGTNMNTIGQYVADGRLRPWYLPNNPRRKFKLSDIWKIPQQEAADG